jgi:hypothetical protein
MVNSFHCNCRSSLAVTYTQLLPENSWSKTYGFRVDFAGAVPRLRQAHAFYQIPPPRNYSAISAFNFIKIILSIRHRVGLPLGVITQSTTGASILQRMPHHWWLLQDEARFCFIYDYFADACIWGFIRLRWLFSLLEFQF